MNIPNEDVQRAIDEKKKIQNHKFSEYFSKIKNKYDSLKDNKERNLALRKLENFVLFFEDKTFNSVFDRNIARQIRKNKGLSLEGLSELLFGKKKYHATLSNYETGSTIPRKTSKRGDKYLYWLKEEGLNCY